MTAATFTPGKTYRLTFIGDSDLHVAYRVEKRTAKFVTVTDGDKAVRCGVKTDCEGNEYALPMGAYSMAPALAARRPIDREVGAFRTGIGV